MEDQIYSTKQLNIAAYLYASGLRFINAENVNGEFFFKFTPRTEADELVSKYFSGSAVVNPRDLFARFHDLKDFIFSQKGGRK